MTYKDDVESLTDNGWEIIKKIDDTVAGKKEVEYRLINTGIQW